MGEEIKKDLCLKHFKNSIFRFSIEVKKSKRHGKIDFLQELNRVKFDNLATISDQIGVEMTPINDFLQKKHDVKN